MALTATIANVTFDCADPGALAEFWAAALGYRKQKIGADEAALVAPERNGPRLLFIRVPEPKTAKNRVHLDVGVDDMPATAERLVNLGGQQVEVVSEDGETWTVMRDPEGNEFCIFTEDA